jgi:DNA-binding transcriptional LysR family regulator
VELMCSDRRVDLVEESFDVAVRAGRLDDSTLVSRPLGALRRVLVATPGYCKRVGTPRTPSELARHACLVFGGGATPDVWRLCRGDEKLDVRIIPRLTVNDVDILGGVVRAGLGVALMPEFAIVGDLADGRLRRVLPAWLSEEVPLQAVYPTVRHLSPKVAAFIDLLRERLKPAG